MVRDKKVNHSLPRVKGSIGMQYNMQRTIRYSSVPDFWVRHANAIKVTTCLTEEGSWLRRIAQINEKENNDWWRG